MDSDPAEDERTYLIEREEKLSETFAAVLVDQAARPAGPQPAVASPARPRPRRWHPARQALASRVGAPCPRPRRVGQHDRARLSPQLREPRRPRLRPRWRGPARASPRGTGALRGLPAVLAWPGRRGPPARAREIPAPRRARSPGPGPTPTWSRGGASAALLPTGPRPPDAPARPLRPAGRLWKSSPADEAWVMSPFFDDGDRAVATARSLEALLLQRGDRQLHFIVAGRRLPDGILELDLPACLAAPIRPRVEHRLHLVGPEPDDMNRPLHAKSLWLRRDHTGAPLHRLEQLHRGRHRRSCRGPRQHRGQPGLRTSRPRRRFRPGLRARLPALRSQSSLTRRPFPRSPATAHPKPEGHALLPAGFGSALLVPGVPHPHSRPRAQRSAAAADSPCLRTTGPSFSMKRAGWRPGAVSPARVPWSVPQTAQLPPGDLADRRWCADCRLAGQRQRPIGPSAPEELRTLSLEDLLDVLSSARPAHEVLGRILKRRAERAEKVERSRGQSAQEGRHPQFPPQANAPRLRRPGGAARPAREASVQPRGARLAHPGALRSARAGRPTHPRGAGIGQLPPRRGRAHPALRRAGRPR